jgi:hypothetical protein
MIISLHLPKTAGTSFGRSLEDFFGDALLHDYQDLPINTPVYQRNLNALKAGAANGVREFGPIRCIHGHFLPLKYLLLGCKTKVRFVTWMRDPVERLVSHYWYWKRSFDPHCAPPLHRMVIEEDWSLERFCLSAELKNFYSQFLWGFPLEMFDFIGIVANYSEDFDYFSRHFLGTRLPVLQENVGEHATDRTHHANDPGFRKSVEKHHQKDMALYRRSLELRLASRGKGCPGVE